MKRMTRLACYVISFFFVAVPTVSAQRLVPKAPMTCEQSCMYRTKVASTKCDKAHTNARNACGVWSTRFKTLCTYQKVADRNKACTKQKDLVIKGCDKARELGLKKCESQHKLCVGGVRQYCKTRCIGAWKGKTEECQKVCAAFNKKRCKQGHLGCKGMALVTRAGCGQTANQRHAACLRNVSDTARCKDAHKGMKQRCLIQAGLLQRACRSVAKAAAGLCPSLCFYSYK